MYYAVDRIEDDTAILISDDGARLEVLIKDLPEIAESDILFFDGKRFTISEEERRIRVEKVKNKLTKLNIKNKRQ